MTDRDPEFKKEEVQNSDVPNLVEPVEDATSFEAAETGAGLHDDSYDDGRAVAEDNPSSDFEKMIGTCVVVPRPVGQHVSDVCRFAEKVLEWSNVEGEVGKYADLEMDQVAELVEEANGVIAGLRKKGFETSNERDIMMKALQDMGYNPTLFRVIGIEKELDFSGLERVAILIRLIHNQVLLPLHIPTVMGRRQYLQIAAFKSDFEKLCQPLSRTSRSCARTKERQQLGLPISS